MLPPQTESFHRATSDIFVGRDAQFQEFRDFLENDGTIRILNIHSAGYGGIGKTQLLLRMMQDICAARPEMIVFTDPLLDFYHIETRSKIGLMRQFVHRVNGSFPTFGALVNRYENTGDASEREFLFPQIEPAFMRDYSAFAGSLAPKTLVVFFDTYEVLQAAQATNEAERAEASAFLTWVETSFFPALLQVPGTRLVVSGRNPLQEIERSQYRVSEIKLEQLSYKEALDFWYQCFRVTMPERLLQKMQIDAESQLHALYDLANGHPILLALTADWVRYRHIKEPFSIKVLLQKIVGERDGNSAPALQQQQDEFERDLIGRVALMAEPDGLAVILMAIAYHRMTPDLFHHLTGTPLEACETVLWQTLQPLSFIKYKEDGKIVLLHDEMRRLVLKHFWGEHDPARTQRKDIAQDILAYYDALLASETVTDQEREAYRLERMSYAFLAKGLEEFCDEFDTALENGQYDYADLLLREAEKYTDENPGDIPLPTVLDIPLRRIRENTHTEKNFADAIQKANACLSAYYDVLQKDRERHGYFLLERGNAEFYSGDFKRAIQSWQDALHEFTQFFYQSGDDLPIHWTKSWIGYAYYRQARFVEAEDYLRQSREGFYQILVTRGTALKDNTRKWRDLLQGLELTHGNLAVLYSHAGQFEKAIRYGEMGADIAQCLPQNNREIARHHNTLGYAFARAGELVNAREQFAKAGELLAQIGSRLIAGRVKINLGFLEYRVSELASVLEFYRAEEVRTIIQQYVAPKQDRLNTAIEFVHAAFADLGKPAPFTKELADAYYHLGWFHTVSSADNHWEEAEKALRKGLKWGKESQFTYRAVSIVESLVNLYYFWDRPEKLKGAVEKTERLYQDELLQIRQKGIETDQFFESANTLSAEIIAHKIRYPYLFGKYQLVLGNIAFDQALKNLFSEDTGLFESGIDFLREALTCYMRAAACMAQFHKQQYYLVLQVVYTRLCTLIDRARQAKRVSGMIGKLAEIEASVWGQNASEFRNIGPEQRRKFSQLLKYVLLRLFPDSEDKEFANLRDHSERVFNKGNYAWALVLTDCLLGVYRELLKDKTDDPLREKFIMGLERQAGLYREVREKYQATQYLREAREELPYIADPAFKKVLTTYLDAREQTLEYRRGEYGRLLELHLQDELEEARKTFDNQFGHETRQSILGVFQRSERELSDIIPAWEHQYKTLGNSDEKTRLGEYLRRFYDLKFRISEFLILEGRGEEALEYLRGIIEKSRDINYAYREANAMQRYVSALYFLKKFEDDPVRAVYEKQIVIIASSPASKQYPSAAGRLRITQGNALFSRYFSRAEGTTPTGDALYRPHKHDESRLRTMIASYVESCHFMAQHSQTNFDLAIEVLQRRIKQIADRQSLAVIQQSLLTLWNAQPALRGKDEERIILDQFTRLRSLII